MTAARALHPFDVDTTAGRIHGARAGAGPPLLLLHGLPQTHLMWSAVARQLADRYTVIATDLRGYGHSAAPESTDYSMRSLAAEQVEVMTRLGFDRFHVAGHDRGARCAYRMAIDHPERVRRLAVLDIIPTADAFDTADHRFALGFWVWSFLGAPAPIPERLLAGDPHAFVDHLLETWAAPGFTFPDDARAAYRAQFDDPARVHAICEQYRCAATTDTALDRADRPRRPIECPTLVLWSASGAVDQWYDPLAVWGRWAADVAGEALPGGHFLPEEVPDVVAEQFRAFFAEVPDSRPGSPQ
ncbi:alpha/beta hydrolase [Nocardia goodfellowii]